MLERDLSSPDLEARVQHRSGRERIAAGLKEPRRTSGHFLSQNGPYESLKTSHKAEIDLVARESLNSDMSSPLRQTPNGPHRCKGVPSSRDELMKVYCVRKCLVFFTTTTP